jgi:hypothetical protein
MKKADGWRLEPHVCRCCFGRIASQAIDGDEDRRQYVCTNCGLQSDGQRVSVLCACGMKIRKGKGKHVDAGLRCHENQSRTMEFPAMFVASYGGAQPKT